MKIAIALLAPLAFIVLDACSMTGPQTRPATATSNEVPATPTKPVTDTYYGKSVTDQYRWLEPLEAESAEVKTWTDAQLAHTRRVLDALPCRTALASQFAKLLTIDSIGAPQMRGDRYFYTERTGTMNQAKVCMRQGFDGAPKTIIDPNTMDAKGLVSLDWWNPSWQGTLVAYGTSFAGSEMSTLKILDLTTGKLLADTIEGKVDFGGWNADGSGFAYSRLTDTKNPYSRVVAWHTLGTPNSQDAELMRQTEPKRVPGAGLSRDGKWLSMAVSDGWGKNDLSVADLSAYFKTGTLKPIVIAKDISASFEPVDVIHDTLYMNTTLGAPKGKLVAVNLNHPEQAAWKVVLPEQKDRVLEGVSMAKGMFVATFSQDASTRMERYDLHGKSLGPVTLPGLGTARISTEDDRTEAFVSFASYNSPRTVYRLDLAQSAPAFTKWAAPTVPAKLDDIVVTQIRATSKDGTQIPAFVVAKKSTSKSGSNPALLYGYGGFTVSLTPEFIPSIVPFLEQGGIYVVANLRGGSEYGEEWHKAGMLDKKQNVFDDLYAVAEKLIADKYTDAAHLAVMGGSNGGLLTGVAVTQRPDLWTAVVCQVPLLDMLRYQQFLMAKFWVPEYGSSEDPKQFAYISAYSPYQKVKAGTKYPAVLFTAGENDSRVHPLHARKMAALMQASTASDASQEPILLYVDREAGHGQGKPLSARIKEAVDQWSFIMWQTGLCK
jgi:prolyl oligopeptidase